MCAAWRVHRFRMGVPTGLDQPEAGARGGDRLPDDAQEHSFLSASVVRELAQYGRRTWQDLVPPHVAAALRRVYGKRDTDAAEASDSISMSNATQYGQQLSTRTGVIAISDMRMDLQYLIDRLETMVRAARRMPMMNKIMMDEQELVDLIDQMRTVLPEEIRYAKHVLREKSRSDARRRPTTCCATPASRVENWPARIGNWRNASASIIEGPLLRHAQRQVPHNQG